MYLHVENERNEPPEERNPGKRMKTTMKGRIERTGLPLCFLRCIVFVLFLPM